MTIHRKFPTACACMALLVASVGTAQAQDEVTIRFSAFVGERNPIFSCSMIPLVEELEANTGTRVTVERYFGGAGFGAAEGQYDQASRGITDIAFGMLTYNEGVHPLSEIISMPFIANNHEHATQVLNDVILPEFLQEELGDVRVVNLWMTSPYQFHLRSPVADPAAMNGTRIRTAGSIQVDALDALGAQVASFPAPATYENLQQGVIDGTTATWTTATAFRVGEVAKYTYEVNFGGAVGFTVMNPDSYARLPDDVREIIDRHSGPEASMVVARCFTEVDTGARAHWLGEGNEAITVSEEDRARMMAQVQPVIESYLQRLEDRGLPAFALRDRALEALAEVDG